MRAVLALVFCIGCAETTHQETTEEFLAKVDAQDRRDNAARAEEARKLQAARDQAAFDRRTSEPQRQQEIAAGVARTHREECAASFGTRVAAVKAQLATFEKVKLGVKLRCAQLAKSCTIAGNGTFACHGLQPDDVRAFGAVCVPYPNVIVVDGSDDCADVDLPSLRVTFDADDEDIAAIRNVKP